MLLRGLADAELQLALHRLPRLRLGKSATAAALHGDALLGRRLPEGSHLLSPGGRDRWRLAELSRNQATCLKVPVISDK